MPKLTTALVRVGEGETNLRVPLRRVFEAVGVAVVVEHRFLDLLSNDTQTSRGAFQLSIRIRA